MSDAARVRAARGDVVQLPHPIANLMRLARNAKGPKDRHDSAYFAWEASVRLAVAARPPSETESLAMPSVGALVAVYRGDDDLCANPEVLAAHAHFSEIGLDRDAKPRAVDGKTLLRALPAYRNKVIGHGSTRPGTFYEDAAKIMLAGLEAAWIEGLFFPVESKLVYVEEIVVDDKGRRARIYDMSGLASSLEDPRGGAVPESVKPGALYVREGDDWTCLHPWIVRHESELRERVLFFNGRARSSKYLDYVSGEELRGKPLAEAFPELEKDVTALFHKKSADAAEEKPDTSVYGGYRIISKIGEGGMGVVHLARHETMGRQVALKLLPRELASDPTAVARFKLEIAALGKCDHANVVKVFASGQAHGTFFYAMELIDGADLSEIARSLSTTDDFGAALATSVERVRRNRSSSDEAPLSRRPEVHLGKARTRAYELAKLMRDAALGLQHLHEASILHRDIKPANLMVTPERRLVIMDLGLATLGDASRSITKDKSSILGTLRYMPPEQLQRNLLQVDRRVDIYALGASFYELLTGRPLFDGDTEVRLVEQVLREEPPHPCKVDPKIPRDLGTIVRKATEKDARLRYDTAAALAADLDAFLEGRPIAARPPTLGYLLTLAVRRNVPLTIAIVAAVVMISGGGLLTLIRETRLRRESDRMRDRAEQGEALAKKTTLGVLEEQGRQQLLADRPLRALLYLSEAYRAGADSPSLRYMLSDATRSVDALVATLRGHEGRIECAQFSRDGSKLATSSRDRTVRVWNANDGKLLFAIAGHTLPVSCARFSNDGTHIVSYGADGTVRVHRSSDGLTLKTFVHDEKRAVNIALFSTNGREIYSGGDDGLVKIWDVFADAPPAILDVRKELARTNLGGTGVRAITSLAVSTDGTRLAASAQQLAIVWDLESPGQPVIIRSPQGMLRDVEFSPVSADVLALAGYDTRARVVNIGGDKPVSIELVGDDQNAGIVRFSHDGRSVATASLDGAARLFNASSGSLEITLRGHLGALYGARFSPSSMHVITASQDDTARIHDARSGAIVAVLEGHTAEVIEADYSPTGARLVTASFDGTARLWRPPTGRQVWSTSSASVAMGDSSFAIARNQSIELRSFNSPAEKGVLLGSPVTLSGVVALSPDGKHVAATSDRDVYLWGAGDPVKLGARDQDIVELLFASNERLVIATERTFEIWDVNKPVAPIVTAPVGEFGLRHLRARGGKLLTYGGTKLATVFDERGERKGTTTCADGNVTSGALHDARLAIGCGGRVMLFDATTLAEIRTIEAHVHSTNMIRFSPNGARFVTVGDDKRANVWNSKDGSLVYALEGHTNYVRDAVFSGRFLVTTSADGTAAVWDEASGKQIGVLPHGAGADVYHVELSGDGRHAITEAGDRVVVWGLDTEARSPAAIAALVDQHVPWKLVDGTPIPRR